MGRFGARAGQPGRRWSPGTPTSATWPNCADAGVAVVTTEWYAPGRPVDLPDVGEWVIKPAVGAGSLDTGRYDLADADHRELAMRHVDRLHAAGRLAMLQPYLPAVDTAGETSLLFLGGEYSHAIRKGPMLAGPDFGVEGLYRAEAITARDPSAAERDLAERVLAATPGWPLLYARVDLIPDPDGAPVLIELELTEPSLFLGTAAGAVDRFASAIGRRLG